MSHVSPCAIAAATPNTSSVVLIDSIFTKSFSKYTIHYTSVILYFTKLVGCMLQGIHHASEAYTIPTYNTSPKYSIFTKSFEEHAILYTSMNFRFQLAVKLHSYLCMQAYYMK
jgi:hypothetical protein